jgi:hypothetical protein
LIGAAAGRPPVGYPIDRLAATCQLSHRQDREHVTYAIDITY